MGRAKESEPMRANLMLTLAGGFAAIAIYSLTQQDGIRLTVFACAALLALASLLVGVFIGFIFGIPKTVTTTPNDTAFAVPAAKYHGNTNLEEISDWLTKILVGAGLVELGKLGAAFGSLSETLARDNALGGGGKIVAPTVIILYAVAGFMLAYLYARIYLARKFSDARLDESPETILGQMNAALYQPGGFDRTIQIGERLLELGEPSASRFWVYMASAYGQKYKADTAANAADAVTAEDRAKALNAVKKAIAMEPALKDLLRTLWKPAPGSSDDDLDAFAADPDFAAVLK
jgi:hypothetical protein